MPLSDIDQQIGLVLSVGDIDPANGDPVLPTAQGVTGIVMQNISRLWLKYADKATVNSRLRDLYIQLEAQDIVIGRLESLVDISTNNGQINVRLSQRVTARRDQRAKIWEQIVRAESMLSKSSPMLLGQIAITSPIAVPQPGDRSSPSIFGPDANDPRFSGSPYWRSSRRRLGW